MAKKPLTKTQNVWYKDVHKHEMEGFDWDEGNIKKNWEKHKVSRTECEEIFSKSPIILKDPTHSLSEKRFYALGKTKKERRLTIVFTIRKNKTRVISARGMSKSERKLYEKENS